MEQIKIIRRALSYGLALSYGEEDLQQDFKQAQQALVELETGMQPNLETYEFDRSQYIKVNFPCKRNQETGQLEQPTTNEELIKEIEEAQARNILNNYTLNRCKTALSQVKLSIWKKYPDEKPDYAKKLICSDIKTGEITICRHFVSDDMYFEPYLWCYEQDLIKTIGE